MKNNVTKQIVAQLKEPSHPPIILLHGDWGIGKTHLIENQLKPILEDDKEYFGEVHHLSVYGLSKTSELKDQLIALYLSGQDKGVGVFDALTSHASGISKLFGADDNEAGLIKGAISSSSSMLRQTAMSKLNGMTLIIDDLERVDNQELIGEILGTCLKLAEVNKLKVIVVANTAEITSKDKLEKTFSEIIELKRSTEDLLEVVREIYGNNCDEVIFSSLHSMLKRVEGRKIARNLRVLKRIINRILKLKSRITRIDDIDFKESLGIISMQISSVVLFALERELDSDKVKDFLTENTLTLSDKVRERIENESNSGEANPLVEADKTDYKVYFGWSKEKLSDLIIDFCFSNVTPDLSDVELVSELSLPIIDSALDKLSTFYKLSDHEFSQSIVELEEILFKRNESDYYEWAMACDMYLFFIEEGYVDKNIKEEVRKLKSRLESGNAILPSSLDGRSGVRRRLNYSDKLRNYQLKDPLDKYVEMNKKIKNEKYIDLFYTDCEKAFGEYSEDYFLNYAFSEKFDEGTMWKAINGWSRESLFYFTAVISKRNNYGSPNVHIADFSLLDSLLPKLDGEIKKLNAGLKKGFLNELYKEFQQSHSYGMQALKEKSPQSNEMIRD